MTGSNQFILMAISFSDLYWLRFLFIRATTAWLDLGQKAVNTTKG